MSISAGHYISSYWLLGDDQLSISKDRSQKDRFLAHFKHSLLFNPSLLLSDSMAIDNANFRHLLEFQPEFRELINSETLTLAIRKDHDGAPRDLLSLRDEFIQKRESRVPDLDKSNDGLRYLSRMANVSSYSVRELSRHFKEKSMAVFENEEVRQRLSEPVAETVRTLASEAQQNVDRDFGLNFFIFELPEQLRRIHPTISDTQIEELGDFAKQPYFTALPTVLDTSSIYAQKHASAFRICGGRSRLVSCGEVETRTIRLTTGLASFAAGIALLPSEKILQLRGSDEARAYFEARNDFNVATLEDSKRYFFIALADYVRRIEEEIIVRVGRGQEDGQSLEVAFDVKERRKEHLVRMLDYTPDLFTYISVSAIVGGHALGYDPYLPVALSLLFVKPVLNALSFAVTGRTSNKMVKDEENLRHLTVDEFATKWKNSERLDANILTFPSRSEHIPSETLYTSERIL